jgi:hypothetical protein
MKWFFQSIRLLTGFSEKQPETSSLKTKRYKTVLVDEAPNELEVGLLYLQTNRGRPLALEFICPCGCGDKIELSLMEENRPSWRISEDLEFPSVSPSIRRVVACRSHFWIDEGEVFYARYYWSAPYGTESSTLSQNQSRSKKA